MEGWFGDRAIFDVDVLGDVGWIDSVACVARLSWRRTTSSRHHVHAGGGWSILIPRMIDYHNDAFAFLAKCTHHSKEKLSPFPLRSRHVFRALPAISTFVSDVPSNVEFYVGDAIV